MRTSQITKTINSLGYGNILDLAIDHAKRLVLSKLEQYNNEIKFFERKYKSDFASFRKKLFLQKKEDFRKEEEANEWEYAIESFKMYNKKLKELEK